MIRKTTLLISGMCMVHAALYAQDAAPANDAGHILPHYFPWLLLIVTGCLIGIILIMYNGFVDYVRKTEYRGAGASPAGKTEAVELAHEYDGIRELDNTLPAWWRYMFYASIIFAIVYWYRYHISGSAPLSIGEYKQEVAEAEAQKAAYLEKAASLVNESNVTQLTESADLENGKKTYEGLCVPCHGAAGEGKPSLGPNLTDAYWLHGGSIKNVFSTIKYGVPGKAMISWQEQLSPRQMQEVASYVLSLQGSNPPNAKEPEGEKYVPEPGAL